MIRYLLILAVCYCAAESKTVCYGDLGCFTDDHPFSWTLQRPIAFLPDSPEKVGTTFRLYTRSHPHQGEIIRHNSIGLVYNPHKPTKFIVHGFLHNGLKKWILDMKDAILSVCDCNVIGVDWSGGNGPFYTQATANTQIVGAEIARFVNTMVAENKADSRDFHVIGHSLGSHIAGYAGERIKGNGLGRITGLDPAGPYFENTHPIVRLDPTDANFVDVIHSDGTAHLLLGLGLMQPVGHVDFYPNGGKDQTDCPTTSGKVLSAIFYGVFLNIDAIEDTTVCSHMAAVYFFTDSITNKKCSYNGYECSSFGDFEAGKCMQCSDEGCNTMGYWATPKKQQGELYLNTRYPLGKNICVQNHGVRLESGKYNGQLQAYGKWTIFFQSKSFHSSSLEILDDYDRTFKCYSVEHRLLSLDTPFNEPIERIYIYYKRTGNWFTFWLYDSEWFFDSVEVSSGDSQVRQRFCQSKVLKSGETVELNKC